SDIEGEEFIGGDGVGTDRDELWKENCNGQKCLSEITDDDIKAMEFSTEQEVINFYTACTFPRACHKEG
ncbi:hypothetical protein A2U01_0108741, partial [Trifolium medium]|nr:hypothetical protein [Trifolium medium]